MGGFGICGGPGLDQVMGNIINKKKRLIEALVTRQCFLTASENSIPNSSILCADNYLHDIVNWGF